MQLKSAPCWLRILPQIAGAVAALLLLWWLANQHAQNVARETGAAVVQHFVSSNMDDMPFGSGFCPAQDPAGITRFIDDTRPLLKNVMVPAKFSPVSRIDLYIERIDDVAGPRTTTSDVASWLYAMGETTVAKAGRDVSIVYSIAVAPNWVAQTIFALLFLVGSVVLWRHVPGGLTREQAFWFHALLDAGASRESARKAVADLSGADPSAQVRRQVFDVLTGRRQYPPETALREVFGVRVQGFDDNGWEWATRLLAADTEPADRIFETIVRLKPTASIDPEQGYDPEKMYQRLLQAPVHASALLAFEQSFGPRTHDFGAGHRAWIERLIEHEPSQLDRIFSAVSEMKPTLLADTEQAFSRLVSEPVNAPALDVFNLIIDPAIQDFDAESWEWLDFTLEYLIEDQRLSGEAWNLSMLWNQAVEIARSDLRVELNMDDLSTDRPHLLVKGIKLRGFEQQGTLIYYGQYLYRRRIGEGWLQNPGAGTKKSELIELQEELSELIRIWGEPTAMKSVVAEMKPLADRLNNGRNLIRKAFKEAFGQRGHLEGRFQLEEELRGRLTAYRVKLSPEQIFIRPFPGDGIENRQNT